MTVADSSVAFCLSRIGRSSAGWDSLILRGSAVTRLSAEDLWAVWADVKKWPEWSPLHVSVTRDDRSELAVGGTFRQELRLGFPLGTSNEDVTLSILEPARRAAWAGDANGVRSCHLWSFDPQPDGGTHIRNTEVLAGFPIALLRPAVGRRWNRAAQGAVDGLVRTAQRKR